jgi:hypothetical protein
MITYSTNANSKKDSIDSLRRCGMVVACWCLADGLLPPNGLLWQFGAIDALGLWLVEGVLATFDLTGLVR